MIPHVVEFKPEHLEGFVGADLDSRWHYDVGGPAFTAMVGSEVLGAAGIRIVRPGVGYAWTVFGSSVPRYPVWITRTIKEYLRRTIIDNELHRIEANVFRDDLVGQQWIELLGFEREGIAHEFTADKKDVVRYEFVVDSFVIQWSVRDEAVEFVAYKNKERVGFAAMRYHPMNCAYGSGFEVINQLRGHEVGLRLHQARLLEAKRHGATHFVAMTDNDNFGMIRILEKCGATRCENELGVTWVTPLV